MRNDLGPYLVDLVLVWKKEQICLGALVSAIYSGLKVPFCNLEKKLFPFFWVGGDFLEAAALLIGGRGVLKSMIKVFEEEENISDL